MLIWLDVLFWFSFLCVATTYILYPLSLWLFWRRRPHDVDPEATPSVCLVISAYNERGVIARKIENALSLDYPSDAFEVMVISDASDDGTDEIVESYADRGVTLYRQAERRGKSLALTSFVPRAETEIVVFSDANSMYEADAIRKLVRHFADPQVGFVAGHQRYVDRDNAATKSESAYWRYETAIKTQESKVGSVVCGDGAIYAIRRELFQPLREDDINDFYLPLKIIERGFRGIFDPTAACYEETADDFAGEFRRKARIVNRSFRAVSRSLKTLSPFHVGSFSIQLFCHKVLRWLVPFFLIAMIVSNAILASQGRLIYAWIMAAQCLFYSIALLGLIPALQRYKVVYIVYYFCLVNTAALIGVVGFCFGRKISTWTPQRSEHELGTSGESMPASGPRP